MKPVRYAVAFVALVFLTGSVVLTLARLLDSTVRFWVLAASLVPWATLGYLVALLLFALLLRRQGWGRARTALLVATCVSLVGLGLHAWWLAPSYVGGHASAKPDLTVIELNLLKGRADPAETADLLVRERAGLVVLTEVTPDALAAVEQRGAVGPGSALPHLAGQALPGASGVVVASAFPVRTERTVALTHPAYVVRVGGPRPFRVLAAHTAQPALDIEAWRRDHATLVREAERLRGPHLVVGDLNATLDHPSLRTLLDAGMKDAAREADAGWQPTWPSPEGVRLRGLLLPFGLFAIDHVLLSSGFSATSTSAPVVRDSDHRALVARLVLPPQPRTSR